MNRFARRGTRACWLAAAAVAAGAGCGGAEEKPTTPAPRPAQDEVGTADTAKAEKPAGARAPANGDVRPIPRGFERGPAPHLVVDGAAEAIRFYGQVFSAEEIYRAAGPDGTVYHAMIRIGDSVVTLADEDEARESRGPEAFDGSPVSLHVYTTDADATFARAVERGATAVQKVSYQFWGDRHGRFEDPFGHSWEVATHIADVSPDEMAELAARAAKGARIEPPEDADAEAKPEGWSTVTPRLVVPNVDQAVDYYRDAVGAERGRTVAGPGGATRHAEITVRDQRLMFAKQDRKQEHLGAIARGGSPVKLTYYVNDAGAAMERFVKAGAEETMPVTDMFWGDRWTEVEDPYGYVWSIATHVEDVSPDEMRERMKRHVARRAEEPAAAQPDKADAETGAQSVKLPQTGVPVCDAYLTKYLACIEDNVPAEASEQLKEAFMQSVQAWKKAAENPETHASLAETCRQATKAAKAAMKQYDCEW